MSTSKHSPFRSMTKSRLQRWLLLFFIALAIPMGLLIRQAYEELQWEAFHQHRLQAEELTTRIDAQLLALINKEEKRSFSDYAFLNVAGSTNFLQRSPLANFPLTSDVPGLLGYFQVDANGKFTTPLLPDEINVDRYGITTKEYQQRLTLQLKLLGILDKNQLVKQQLKPSKRPAPASAGKSLDKIQAEADDSRFYDIGASSISSIPASEESRFDSADTEMVVAEIESTEAEVPMSAAPIATAPVISQLAFDELKSMPRNAPLAKNKVRKNLGRVADLKLNKTYEARTENFNAKKDQIKTRQALQQNKRAKTIYKRKSAAATKVRRETNRLPETKQQAPAALKEKITIGNEIRIHTFESEIDAFELSLLDSGHFVLYRKVWRNGQRIIQGLLIEQQEFIENAVKTAYLGTSLSAMSHLLVAWQGDVISRFQSSSALYTYRTNSEFNDTLLYQTALSQPLGELQLIFSIHSLPVGPSANIINWIAGILLLVMMIGFYLIYRSGVRQIHLLQQQQDFVSAVSHELKTPLTSIRMYGEILQEDWASEEKKKNYYDLIVGESERLTRLINNVLQLARFSRSAIQSNLQDIKISELMDMARSATSTPVSAADFELKLQCDDSLKQQTIHVDTDHFTQIMINLIDNALKFSVNAENKTIELACRKVSSGKIQISVRDYGPGIAKNQMKKIFTLFYRAEDELTRETVGTGIGLALVNQLMREMSGEVDVQNMNPGTQFILTFKQT